MRCIEDPALVARRHALARLAGLATLLAGCASGRGVPVNLGPRVALAPAPAARTWDEFKRGAARRMVSGSPGHAYLGEVPPVLLGIPVLEIEVHGDGRVRDIVVVRAPSDGDAQDTIEIAMEAVRRGAPYGDMSRLARPWKWTEVFLFNDKRQFKPRILD